MNTITNEIDEYIAGFPVNAQKKLEQLRTTIRKAIPEAEEVISYKMPAYKLNGILVYFAGYKNHIGFYPTASPMKVFKNDLTDFKTSKGAIQFQIDKPLPTKLVTKIVKFRVQETLEKANTKMKMNQMKA